MWFDSAERFLHSAAFADVPRTQMKRQIVEATVVTTDTTLTRMDWIQVRDDIVVISHGAKSWAAPPDWSVKRTQPYYVGSYHAALDFDFLVETARLSDTEITLVGEYPSGTLREGLVGGGWSPGGDIPHRLSDGIAGLVPYTGGEWCAGVFPSKVFDYLLAGLPVISTRLSALDDTDWTWQVDSPEQAAAFVRRAIELSLDDRRAVRDYALENTWESRFEAVSSLLGAQGVPGF